jgi:hypothetical protein
MDLTGRGPSRPSAIKRPWSKGLRPEPFHSAYICRRAMFSAFDRTRVHFGVVACSAVRTVANVRNNWEEGGGAKGARREMGYTRDSGLQGVSEPMRP